MTMTRPVLAGLLLILGASSWTYAQAPAAGAPAPGGPPPAAAPRAGQAQTQTPPPTQTPTPPPAQKPPDPTFKENVVVSASKTEQQLVDAPATMTVIGPKQLDTAPSNNYADLLRAVPGLNITQISARDINVNSRAATSSLATAQLAVVDGRSIYQDFFGFTMWEFMPSDLAEIKRIEVIRGPASAVWGANALNGVINVITKSPREMPGTRMSFGIGSFDREVNGDNADSGALFYVRGSHAQVLNDRWSFKVTAGMYSSDALARPTGLIPNGGTTAYPVYKNEGTQQPKFDARVDYDFEDPSRKLVMAAGVAGTDGMMHTGIGPFRIRTGSQMTYWKTTYTKNAFKLQAFMNMLEGSATNVVSVDPSGAPIGLDFDTKTFDLEMGDSRILGGRNVLTYGGNLRVNRFDLTIAPGENSRNEGGVYIQEEFMAGDKVRLVAGARVDKFSSIDNAVFSPRVAVVLKPVGNQSVRVSYNRAFRAPSMINNHLSTTVATPIPLGLINPAFGSALYRVPTTAVGNTDLTEESIDAFEVAYTGHIRNRTTLSAAVFYTTYKDGIYFTTTGTWQTAPPGFPGLGPFTPNQVWGGFLAATGLQFPSNYTYRNLGEVKNKGIELGIDTSLTDNISGFATYAFQADPEPEFPNMTPEQALAEINIPSQHLFSFGLSATMRRAYMTLSFNRASKAFWQDVLDARFSGITRPTNSLNLTLGTTWHDGQYGVAFKATNLTNETNQQHIFGDIVKRQMAVEFRLGLK